MRRLRRPRSGQLSFFGTGGADGQDTPPPRFPNVEPWSEMQLLQAEKETLGFFVSSHPLVRPGRELASLSTPQGVHLTGLGDFAEGAEVTIGCMISKVRPTVTKTGRSAGKKMAMLTIEDLTGKCDAVVFSDAYARLAEWVRPEEIVFLQGTVDCRRERPSLVVDELIPIDRALEKLTGRMVLRLAPGADPREALERLRDVLARHRGACPTSIELRCLSRADARVTVRPDKAWCVAPSRELIRELTDAFGEEAVVLCPKAANGNHRRFLPRKQRTRQADMFRRAPAAAASPAVTRFD